MTKLKPHQIEAGTETYVLTTVSGKSVWAAAGGAGLPVIDVVTDHGAVVDGTTDDTAAWQAALNAAGAAGGARIISSLAGVSIIAGALQDTSGANAQLLLPSLHTLDDESVTITIEGPFAPASGISVGGAPPLPVHGLVLKSTLTSGSGGALLGAYGPTGSFDRFTYVDLWLRNIAFRMPTNPTHTALDLRKVAALDMDGVVVDCGSYDVLSIAEPTTTTSWGVRTPALNNGAHVRIGWADVVGFYNGWEFAEHVNGIQPGAWACMRAFTFVTGGHACIFQRIMAHHCQRIIIVTGIHYFEINELVIEHAASTWKVTDYDIYDPSNLGHGAVKWAVGLAGTGIDNTFTVSGGSGITYSRVGTQPSAASTLIFKDEGSTLTSATTSVDVVGAGATATNTGGAVTLTIPERVPTGGTASQVLTKNTGTDYDATWATPGNRAELLMQDGVSAPPVPIENEARTDWLYQD